MGPFTMLGKLAGACLPDLPTCCTGIILVGPARCIAMVMIRTYIAKRETNYCAILLFISMLHVILYSLLFINIIGHKQSIPFLLLLLLGLLYISVVFAYQGHHIIG